MSEPVTKESLRSFYDSSLAPMLTALHESIAKERKKAAATAKIALPITAAGIILAFIPMLGPKVRFISCIIAVISACVAIYQYLKIGSSANHLFKTGMMPAILEFIDPSLKFSSGKMIPASHYCASGLFGGHYDRYSGEDLIKGCYNGVEVALSELHTEEEHRTRDKNGNTHTYYTTIFKGVFIIADFNKDFKHRTIVVPDVAEKLFGKLVGNFFQGMNIGRPGKLVKLEDIDFEKLFAVYSSNDIEARYLLTPKIMEAMVELTRRFGGEIYFSFVDSRLYIAIPNTKDFFEMSRKCDYTFEDLEKNVSEILCFLRIVDDLSLNVRIWTKK